MFYGNSYLGSETLPARVYDRPSSGSRDVAVAPAIEEQVAAEEEIKAAVDSYLKSVNATQLLNLYHILQNILKIGNTDQKDTAYILYREIRLIQAYRKELSLGRVLHEGEDPKSDLAVARAETKAVQLGAKLGIRLEVEGALNDLSSAEEVISRVPLYPIVEGQVKEDTSPSPSPGKDLKAVASAQGVLTVGNAALENYHMKSPFPPLLYWVGGALGLAFLIKLVRD